MARNTDTARGDDAAAEAAHGAHPSAAQKAWLKRGLTQPGGKLPLFDEDGQQVCERTVRACIDKAGRNRGFPTRSSPIGSSAS